MTLLLSHSGQRRMRNRVCGQSMSLLLLLLPCHALPLLQLGGLTHRTHFFSFCVKVPSQGDEAKAVDVVLLDFSKTFKTFPHSLFPHKLSSCGIRRFMMCWVKTWLKGRAQTVVESGVPTVWRLIISGVPQG